MKSSLASSRVSHLRRAAAALSFVCLALAPARLAAQCTLASTPVSFEPSPPGAARPASLSSGFSNSLGLFTNATGKPRIGMIEAWGYSTLDLTNPVNPSALVYDDLRLDATNEVTNQVKANGDGQSYIQTFGVSADGQRVVLSVNGPAEPTWHTLVGRPNGDGFGIWGDFGGSRASGTVVLSTVGSRYIAFATQFAGTAIVADVTNLPTAIGSLSSLNMTSESTAFPAGVSPSVAGTYIVYTLGDGTGIEVVDASNPGPFGNVSGGLKSVAITSAVFGRAPTAYAAAVDPVVANKLWVVVELPAATGENSPSYGLVSISKDGNGNLQAPVSAGPLFRVPSVAGETWRSAGSSASLVASNGTLFVLMWATRSLPSQQFVLYSTSTTVWGQVAPTPSPVAASGFGLAATIASAMAGTGNAVYQYLPTGPRAFVVPLTCQPANAPAASVLAVTNAGATLLSGGTAFVGDTLNIVPTIFPPPASKPLMTWGWNFDFDFHVGNATEDATNLVSPRIKNPDLTVANAGANPPTSINYTGPCDPKAGGDPISNPSACWNSVLTNSAAGGPDFLSTDPAGTTKALPIALEANNQFGSAGAALFTVNWKIPAAKILSPLVLSGQALQSASEGHPLPNGYKWYFGATANSLSLAAGCTTASCVPTFSTRGTYFYWLVASYANGYQTPDYVTGSSVTTMYTVTDFAPAFTVNSSATGPVTAVIGASLLVQNNSQKGAAVSGAGGYYYYLCQIPSGQSSCPDVAPTSYTLWGAMGDPPSSASIPGPAVGNWLLRIRVNYTNPTGSVEWPDPTGVNGFPLTVTAAVPKFRVWVNGQNPCPPGPFCLENSFSAHPGDTLKAYSYVNGVADDATVNLSWDFTPASPSTFTGNGTTTFSYGTAGSFNVSFTRNGAVYSFPNAANITVRANPLVVTATGSPNPAYDGQQITFSCQATGGSGSYSYAWSSGFFNLGTQQNLTVNANNKGSSPLTYSATCTATDGSTSASQTANVTIYPPQAPACTKTPDFSLVDVATGATLVLQSSFVGGSYYVIQTGQLVRFVPNAAYDTYVWDFGDGTNDVTNTSSSPVHAYASGTSGGYRNVSMTVTGSGICGTSKSYAVTVTGPTGLFSALYEDSSPITYSKITAYKNIVFTAYDPPSRVDSYSWDFGDNTPPVSGPTATTATHPFGPGTWIVRLTVTKGSFSTTTTQSLTVDEPAKWVVPGMAYVNGQVAGSLWQSDVTIFNPDPNLKAIVRIAFLDGRNPVTDFSNLQFSGRLEIPPLGSIGSANLLGDAFGQSVGAYGALLVQGDVAPLPLVMTARTFNNGDPTKGTFGLSVPSASVSGGVSAQASPAASVLVGLRENATAYTNIGLVNLRNDWPSVELDYYDQAGTALGTKTIGLKPYQSLQITRALKDAIGPDATSDLYAIKVKILQGSAVYPYATVIDSGSTDPIVVTPSASPANAYRIPGIVRLTGAHGEEWRSRITLSNPSLASRKVTLTFSYVPCDATGCGSRVAIAGDVNFAGQQSQSWDDFVNVWLTVKGHIPVSDTTTYKDSFLDVAPADGDTNQEPLVVLGETYDRTATGHVGLQVPGYTPSDGASRTGANKRLVFTGLASTASYRTNLALFGVAGATSKWASVHVYSPQGTKLKDYPVLIERFTQIDSAALFGGLSGDLSRLSVVVDNFDDGITIAGYATIIDNVSGDATFVKAQPAP